MSNIFHTSLIYNHSMEFPVISTFIDIIKSQCVFVINTLNGERKEI